MTHANGMLWNAYFTDKTGGIAKLSGDLTTLSAIEKALEAAGWRFDEVSGSWDEGFYSTMPNIDDSPVRYTSDYRVPD